MMLRAASVSDNSTADHCVFFYSESAIDSTMVKRNHGCPVGAIEVYLYCVYAINHKYAIINIGYVWGFYIGTINLFAKQAYMQTVSRCNENLIVCLSSGFFLRISIFHT